MRLSVIRIAATLAGTLLLAGCSVQLDPAQEEIPISFSAGSQLLRDDATKGATPKTPDDKVDFWVFGTKTVSATTTPVFWGSDVTYSAGSWSYNPLRFWDPSAIEYDFLGISGPGIAPTNYETSPILKATVTYNIAPPNNDNYDLMGACRTVPRESMGTTVMMSFEHFLSAVSVVVYNDSPHQHVSLISYCFRNLYYTSAAEISYNISGHPSLLWKDKVKDTTNPLLGWTPNGTDGRELGPSTHAPVESSEGLYWDMMIPQTLNPLSLAPLLVVTYSLVDYSDDPEPVRTVSAAIETPIRLNTIKNSHGEEILEWVEGKKYIYEIHIRYGGGISVTVITTDWDEVKAGTPGLIIS